MPELSYTELIIGVLSGGSASAIINRGLNRKKVEIDNTAVVNKILRETVQEIQDAYKKEIGRLESKIDELRSENNALRTEIVELRQTIQQYEERTQCDIADIKKKIAEKNVSVKNNKNKK